MKPASCPAFVLLTTISVLLFSGMSQSGAVEDGRLIIKWSPTLGYNVALTIRIDGKLIGPIVRGHTFDRHISPGRHVLLVQTNRLRGDWQQVLDVRPGQTYAYLATYNVQRLALNPTNPNY